MWAPFLRERRCCVGMMSVEMWELKLNWIIYSIESTCAPTMSSNQSYYKPLSNCTHRRLAMLPFHFEELLPIALPMLWLQSKEIPLSSSGYSCCCSDREKMLEGSQDHRSGYSTSHMRGCGTLEWGCLVCALPNDSKFQGDVLHSLAWTQLAPFVNHRLRTLHLCVVLVEAFVCLSACN